MPAWNILTTVFFYREFGENDIKNLPLTKNGERITYNGLKQYLRELEHNDFHVSVKIFDRKGEYQSLSASMGCMRANGKLSAASIRPKDM